MFRRRSFVNEVADFKEKCKESDVVLTHGLEQIRQAQIEAKHRDAEEEKLRKARNNETEFKIQVLQVMLVFFYLCLSFLVYT